MYLPIPGFSNSANNTSANANTNGNTNSISSEKGPGHSSNIGHPSKDGDPQNLIRSRVGPSASFNVHGALPLPHPHTQAVRPNSQESDPVNAFQQSYHTLQPQIHSASNTSIANPTYANSNQLNPYQDLRQHSPPQSYQSRVHNPSTVAEGDMGKAHLQSLNYLGQPVRSPYSSGNGGNFIRQSDLDDEHSSLTKSEQSELKNDGKKKRGRPKKLILDPSTNTYIDSQHPHFKHLNKLLRESSPPTVKSSNTHSRIITSKAGDLVELFDQPVSLRKLEDEAVKKLLERKDRRGRPRKFPVEQTGLTIKGIRVNGVVKQKKKRNGELTDGVDGFKRERGRPKKTQTYAEVPTPAYPADVSERKINSPSELFSNEMSNIS